MHLLKTNATLLQAPFTEKKLLLAFDFVLYHTMTKPSTCFIIDPQFESAKLLRNWITENGIQVDNMIRNKSYHTADISLRPPLPEHIIPIKDINDMLLMRTTFWLKELSPLATLLNHFGTLHAIGAVKLLVQQYALCLSAYSAIVLKQRRFPGVLGATKNGEARLVGEHKCQRSQGDCLKTRGVHLNNLCTEGSSKLKRLNPTSQIAESNPQALVMSVMPLSPKIPFCLF